MLYTSSALAAALFALAANAQTFTDCNPTEQDCPDNQALGVTFEQTFNRTSELNPELWNITASYPSYSDDGMEFVVEEAGQSVNVKSNFYIFFGQFEMIARMSPGAGLISTSVLLSETLDEIDWEVVGSNNTHVLTNYYGQGDRTQMNGADYPSTGAPQDGFHNYTMNWTQEEVQWIYDGNVVRTVAYDQAVRNGSSMFPQTPSHVNMGLWAAGDSDNQGTSDWAGGRVDWSQAPFVMTIRSIRVVDHSTNATSYHYSDRSGTFESIEIRREGVSRAAEEINRPPPKSISQRFNELPQGARLAIIISPLAALALAIILGCFCCVKQRKLGRRERAIEDAQWEKDNAEMLAYRKQMSAGVFSRGSAYQPAPRTPSGW